MTTGNGPAPAPRDGTGFFAFGEGGAVFSEAAQNLYALDPVAAYCWLEISAGQGRDAIAAALAKESGLDDGDARNHVETALSRFAEADLLDDGHAPTGLQSGVGEPEIVPPAGLAAALAATTGAIDIQVLGHRLRVEFGSPDLADHLRPILSCLEFGPPAPPATTLAVVEAGGTLYGCIDGVATLDNTVEPSPAALMERLIYETVLARSDFLLTIHGGVVGAGGGRAWLALPATPGSGKSTLTAALAAAGFAYGSDELMLLGHDLSVRPLSFPMCIKEASWPVLARRYPGLATSPVHHRYGHRARYLPPPAPLTDNGWRPVAGFVFPRYAAEAATALVPLDPMTGMVRLFDQCLYVPRTLDLADVGRLVDFCARTPFYELPLSNLDAATTLVRDLVTAS